VVGSAETIEELQAARMNQMPATTAGEQSATYEPSQDVISGTLILGPVSAGTLVSWMTDPSLRDAFLTDANRSMPGRHRLIWDAARSQAWVYLDRFSSVRQLDEWQAWLEQRELAVSVQQSVRLPVGDVYVYHLGDALVDYSIELDRQAEASVLLQRMVSPEVLWFQAYQSINDEPPTLVVQWHSADQRFHLVASGFARTNDARRAWQNLSSVGLMPSLPQ
jgi:hypothetical protein